MVQKDESGGDDGGAKVDASVDASRVPAPSHAVQPADGAASATVMVPLCWPFPPGSQNHTDKAVKLKPYVPPKRRSLNQY